MGFCVLALVVAALAGLGSGGAFLPRSDPESDFYLGQAMAGNFRRIESLYPVDWCDVTAVNGSAIDWGGALVMPRPALDIDEIQRQCAVPSRRCDYCRGLAKPEQSCDNCGASA